MPKREPRQLPPSPFVTVYRKSDGQPVQVSKAIAERIKNPPEGQKSNTFTTTKPKSTKEKSE